MIDSINRKDLVGEQLLNGNASDTGWSNDWTATDVTRVDTERGFVKECGSFNGSTSHILSWNTLDIWDTTRLYTMCCWFKTTDWGRWDIIERNDWWPDNAIDMGRVANKISFRCMGWTRFTDTQDMNDWKPHFVAIRKTWATTAEARIDNKNIWSINVWSDDRWSKLDIGRTYNSWNYFNWEIWLVREYNVSLTDSEMNALYIEWLRRLWQNNYPALFEGAVAYYNLDWDASDIIWGNNWTVSWATLTTDHLGFSNHAYNFDGDNDYIDSNLYLSDSSFSVSQWIKFDDVASYDWIFTTIDSDWTLQWTRLIWNKNWYIAVVMYDSWGSAVLNSSRSSTALSNNTWYHIVLTYSWNDCKLYLDWVDKGTLTSTADPDNAQDTLEIWWYYTWGNTNNHNWEIDEPAIRNRALSADEVKELYTLQSKHHILPRSKTSTNSLQDWLVLDIDWTYSWTTYYDQSWESNNWTASGWVSDWGRIGKHKIMSFDGTDDYISSTLTTWIKTLSFWITKTDVTDNTNMLVGKAWVSAYIWQIHSNWNCYSDLWWWNLAIPHWITENNTRYHLVFTTDWSNMKLYNNWVLMWSPATTSHMRINELWGSTKYAYYYDWNITNFKAYTRVLSAKEIEQLYYRTFIPNI